MYHGLYLAVADVEAALVQSRRLTELLRGELESMVGRVGTNDDMRGLLEAASVSWNWETLCENRPCRKHTDAFERVCEILKPHLQHTLFPEGLHSQQCQRRGLLIHQSCASCTVFYWRGCVRRATVDNSRLTVEQIFKTERLTQESLPRASYG